MEVSVSDAKAQITDLVRRAEAGEQVVLTRFGRPVAKITPIAPPTTAAGGERRFKLLAHPVGATASPGPGGACSQYTSMMRKGFRGDLGGHSALMEVILDQPMADACIAVLERADDAAISVGTPAETLMVAGKRGLGHDECRSATSLSFTSIPPPPHHPAGSEPYGDCFRL